MSRNVWIDFNASLALLQANVRWLTGDTDRMQRRSKLAAAI